MRIMNTFLTFKETEESRLFPNGVFGYWNVTVERSLRIKGIDPEGAYRAKEIKAFKDTAERDEAVSPIIKKIHKKDTESDPWHGLFTVTIRLFALGESKTEGLVMPSTQQLIWSDLIRFCIERFKAYRNQKSSNGQWTKEGRALKQAALKASDPEIRSLFGLRRGDILEGGTPQ